MKQHRGEIVERAVRSSGFSIKKLAEKLGISRNTLYNRFKDPELGAIFIEKVSNIIHYDFTTQIPELQTEDDYVTERSLNYSESEAAKILQQERKHVLLLEKYNQLLRILTEMANTNELPALRQEIVRFLEDHKN